MPYLVAIAAVVAMGVAAVFSFFTSGASAEKYENSVLESQWATINKDELKTPEIIHVKTSRDYVVLADPLRGDVLLTLLNPEDGKSVRTFPDQAYVPSRAAIGLLQSDPSISADVAKQLIAKTK